MKLAAIASAFGNRDYALYAAGNFISLVGLWMQRIGVGWLTWQLTESPFWLGAVAFADLFPALIVGPFAGVLADRYDRRRILVWTQALSFGQAATLAALTEFGHINVHVVFTLTLLLGIVAAVSQPARLTLVPALVRRDDLNAAFALNSVSFNTARFIGPVVAGAIVAVADIAATFAANALTYLAMLVTLLLIRADTTPSTRPRRGGVLAELWQGTVYSLRHPVIAPLLMVISAMAILGKPVADLLPGFADVVFARGAAGLATLVAAMGAGAIAGGVWLAGRGSTDGLVDLAIGSTVAGGVLIAAFAFCGNYWLAIAILALASAALSVVGITTQTLIQSVVDDDKRGRVVGIWGLIFRGAPSLGVLAIGTAAEVVGLPLPLAAAGILCAAAGLYALRFRQRLVQQTGKPNAPAAMP